METQHTEYGSAEPYDLRVSVAAKMLGVSRDTLYRYEKDGRIKARRTPTGHRRFRECDVRQLITQTAEENAKAGA